VAITASGSQKRSEETISVPTRVRHRERNGRGRGGRDENHGLVEVGGDFYILASAMASRRSTRVLSQGESFALFESSGDILNSGARSARLFPSRYASLEPL